MRTLSVGPLLIALGLLTLPSALGQDRPGGPTRSFLRQQRTIEETLDQERRKEAPLESLLDWQWGGWIDYFLFHYDDGVQSSRVYQRPGLAIWTRLEADDGAHQLFARVRLNFAYFNPGDEYDRQQDWIGPNFDRAFYQLDVGRAFRLTERDGPLQLVTRVGRQEVTFGTGYALDLPLDAVVLDAKVYDLRATGLFARTIASFPNIDRSPPVRNHSDRRFYGVQLAYEGLTHHTPFAYALWNEDFTDERPTDLFQAYDYDSQYYGVGSRGSLVRNLTYWAEFVHENGTSFGAGNFKRRDQIHAWAWNVGLEYLFDVPTRPRLSGEYMFASGDSDRLFSPTDATGGNRYNREDTGFVGFGYRDTGIAFAPTLSNLHVWRAGGAFLPFERVECLRSFELGTNWFLYHKNRTRAAISDATADEFAGWVGWEMDYFVNWRLASDVSWTVRWGAFFPGSAFSDRDTRQFVFTGLTWSF